MQMQRTYGVCALQSSSCEINRLSIILIFGPCLHVHAHCGHYQALFPLPQESLGNKLKAAKLFYLLECLMAKVTEPGWPGGPWPPTFQGYHTHSCLVLSKKTVNLSILPVYNSLLSALSQNYASFIAILFELDCFWLLSIIISSFSPCFHNALPLVSGRGLKFCLHTNCLGPLTFKMLPPPSDAITNWSSREFTPHALHLRLHIL
jgi:hypothetical protein